MMIVTCGGIMQAGGIWQATETLLDLVKVKTAPRINFQP